jgi:hypothetical protein
MSSDARQGIRGVVLAEDRRTERFLRYLLEALGFEKRRFRFDTAPCGKGAAEAWVRARYPGEVAIIRSKSYQHGLGLVAIRDGDKVGVEQRKAEMSASLADAQLDDRAEHERIATPVPTWSIETWLLALRGTASISETESMKRAYETFVGTDERSVLRECARAWLSPRPDEEPPSLADGRKEMARLDT